HRLRPLEAQGPGMKLGWAIAAAAAAPLLFASAARAQDPPQGPTDGAVPRGPGGAVVKPPDEKPEPKHDLATATPPKPLNNPQPVYPPEAEQEKLQAQVILRLEIDKKGHVTKATV